MRVQLPKTIPSLSIEGVTHLPDGDNVFDLPDHHAHVLVRTMGGEYAWNIKPAPKAEEKPVRKVLPSTSASAEKKA